MHRTVCAAIIAVLLVVGSHFAVHYAFDAVAKASSLESRLFQPELRPGGQRGPVALARAASGSIE